MRSSLKAVCLVLTATGLAMERFPVAGLPGPTRLVRVCANCKCTPALKETLAECDPTENMSDCYSVSVSVGEANSPECNAVELCTTLINCDAGKGQVSITIVSPAVAPCPSAGSIGISLNGTSVGSVAAGSGATLSFAVGGDAVACTDVDNEEGNGDVIRVGVGAVWCEFEVRDGCKKCPTF